MPYEAGLIRRLGFEIFIPKILPKPPFRSGAIDPTHDISLSIPRNVLEKLNQFNFYEDVWTTEIVTLINRYFGAAFVIPHGRQVEEAVDNFEGQIVFRAFGLINDQTYRQVVDDLYGPLTLRKIAGIKGRFWFGEAYDHLHECEAPLFAERSLFLPVGIPETLLSTAGQWSGSDRKILFICPHALTSPYYSAMYRQFKKDFGDLPHVIVGEQPVPVLDTHHLGFVTDEELRSLYLNCAVLYYPSIEIRHVHYSPIEAAVNGMPIVFFKGSLLDRLGGNSTKGRVGSIPEARYLIERILLRDSDLIEEIKKDQQKIAGKFSDSYCSQTWHAQMEARGFFAAMKRESRFSVLLRETSRTLLKPIAHGRTKVQPHKRAVQPVRTSLTAEQARAASGWSIYQGIDFRVSEVPLMVDYISGLSANEGWGRWSTGRKITIVLRHHVEGTFRFYVRAVGYGPNAATPIPVTIGSQTRSVRLSSRIEDATRQWLDFDLRRPTNVIEISVPHPVRLEMDDTRSIGIGMIEIGAAPRAIMSAAQAKLVLASSLEDGIDFRTPHFPIFVERVQGLSTNETWGRWSDGQHVLLELKHTLSGRFRLLVRAVGYGPNIGVPVSVKIGRQARTLKLPAQIGPDDELTLDFNLREAANIIEITVPHPMQPPGDGRAVGIGFLNLRAEVGSSAILAANRHRGGL